MNQRDELEAIRLELMDGGRRFESIEETLRSISDGLEALQKDVKATREVVEAWTTVKNVGRFTKWIAGIVTAITAIAVAIKLGFTHLR